jgi:hypothetical protein
MKAIAGLACALLLAGCAGAGATPRIVYVYVTPPPGPTAAASSQPQSAEPSSEDLNRVRRDIDQLIADFGPIEGEIQRDAGSSWAWIIGAPIYRTNAAAMQAINFADAGWLRTASVPSEVHDAYDAVLLLVDSMPDNNTDPADIPTWGINLGDALTHAQITARYP